jgi:hypothetical protein
MILIGNICGKPQLFPITKYYTDDIRHVPKSPSHFISNVDENNFLAIQREDHK